jgi:anti-sigma factor RsiW
MQTLPESDLATVEEHLPVCLECRERLFETALYIKAMRSAARRIRREEATARG